MSKIIALAIGHFLVLVALFPRHALAASYTHADIGPSKDGTLTAVTDGYDISGHGRDIGGTSDELAFGYEKRTGNFDLQTRLQSVTITDAFVHAGLMARASLEANSPFAAIFSSSALLGTFFESRSSAGASAQSVVPVRAFPANYPQMFLRLRRSGNTFTGFASFDGKEWQQLGSASVALPSEVFLGIAVASLNTNAVSTASFRDLKEVTAPITVNHAPLENLGPSNRRTGLVFSEIMYNPGPRTGEDLEFIELFNAESFFLDLTGWKIAGGVHFSFPPGFRMEAGQFVVIAADPGAIQRAYGLTNVLGPYTGRLNNSGESLRLLNASGAIRLEVKYGQRGLWPAAADGAGHSLVLTRPSFGEDDPRAWSASERVGGSPGEVNARWPNPWRGVVLNEVMAGDGQEGFVELYNATTNSIDISRCMVTADIRNAGYRVPDGTILPAQGFLVVSQFDLTFNLRSADRVLLVSTNANRVLDIFVSGWADRGVSFGRVPDGGERQARLEQATPNRSNASRKIESVVINEIMYNPITGQEQDSYVELYNRSAQAIDLSGWRLSEGVQFQFPQGASIAPGSYLVVAQNAAHLQTIYPQLNSANTIGDFEGSLSGSGERVELSKPSSITVTNAQSIVLTNLVYVAISEVTYSDGGRWPELADGGGSSLELVDARTDTTLAANWAASDERGKSEWSTVEVTSKVEMGSSAYAANRLQVLMLGAGECLVDNIELIPAGSTNILVNGDFEAANTTWRFFGNHSDSKIEADSGFGGSVGLHVTAPGDGDTGNNTIRGNLTRNLPTSGTATIRARVRWLAGWPEVLFRVRGNWIELPARMTVPRALGTPGLANSRRENNGGPAIYEVTHTPALPRAAEPVVITCRISDPDGAANPQVQFRVDPNQSLSSVAMHDDGLEGDALRGDGIYSARIGGFPARTLVAFRILSSDDSATSTTSIFPANAPAEECLIKWDDPIPFGTFAHYHLWSTAATESARNSNRDLDNTFRDATLVYGNARVVYNAGFRDKGSPYHNGGGDFAVTVPRSEPLLGVDDRVFASTGNGGDEGTYLKGDMAGWVAEELGIPFLHSHYMRLFRNGNPYRSMMYDMEQPNRYFAKSWLGGGGVKDDLFKIAIWFEFDDNNSSFSSQGATLQRFLSDGQFKLARYRWNWQLRPSTETANDYSTIFNLSAAANNATDRIRTLPLLADMEEWMRVFGYHRVTGNWDSYTYNVGQNMYLYAPLGQRAAMIPWDIDFVLGEGDGPTASTLFTAGTDSVMQTLFNLPMYKRMLWRAYQDAVHGPLVAANFQPQIDARRAALTRNGVGGNSPASITTYMNSRRNYLAGQIQRADAGAFSITSNNGEDFTNNTSTATLTGTAPFAVASIEVNGVPFPVTWTSPTNWQMTVPLGARNNLLQLQGRDLRGQVLTGAVDNITVQFAGTVPQPSDWVVINEINYHPASPDAEFVEVYNNHPSFAFDLSGFRLEGIDFTFPGGSLIQPNGFLVIVKDRASFANAYGPTIPVLGPYNGRLQIEGETLRLMQSVAGSENPAVIDEVRYSNALPWPADADGLGPSLQLIDPGQDNTRVGNWLATKPNDAGQATPGRPNAGLSTLIPFPDVSLNEVEPLGNPLFVDNFNQDDPWIELYNRGSSSIDLSGLFLSDDPAQLAKWQFPGGTQIDPHGFLIVWADGTAGQSRLNVPHTSFRLGATNGLVILSRLQGTTSAVVDYLSYRINAAGKSFGSYPDGDAWHRRILSVVTPGTTNNASIPNVNIALNEWAAATQSVIRDPADGQFEDWFELYNAGTNTVDLTGFYLTDNQSDSTQFQIPVGYTIGPGEYRLIWADGEPQQNASGRDLHVNFSLRAEGESIALFTPDEQLVTTIGFSDQTSNLSEGLYPNGSTTTPVLFSQPTPGAANLPLFANRRPSISPVADQTLSEGESLLLTIAATDADVPEQTLTYSLVSPLNGATLDEKSGQFSWTPSEDQAPGLYTVGVRVADNGTPALSTTINFDVAVREVNVPPVVDPVTNLTLDEGVPFSTTVTARDEDLPAQVLSFSVDGNLPEGVTLDATTGELAWTPSEQQGPGNYSFTVLVSDNAKPPLAARATFNVMVRDINNPPVIAEIPVQGVDEGLTYTYQVEAFDPETPPATLAYSLVNAPAGMSINPNTGFLSWTPGEADGPRDYNITIEVSEPGGSPSSSTSFLLGVRELNRPPTFSRIADVNAHIGDMVHIQPAAADLDLPAQTLSFRVVGNLPPGANLSPITGEFTWSISEDPPLGANRITIEVSDNGTPALTATQSFNVVIRAPLRVAINEIMHRPSAVNARYIELLNYSAVNTLDLSGWRVEGYEMTLPSGTVLAPGALLCVTPDAAAFRAAYGDVGAIVAGAVNALGPDGGIVRLIKPGGAGFPDEVIDEVLFSLKPPWPAAAATQGASLQLVDPWTDHRRVLNWAASAGTTTDNAPVEVLPLSAAWRYYEEPTAPANAWLQTTFNDSAWKSGGALLYKEESALPAPKNTALTLGQMSYYFRTHFNFNGNPNGATLKLRTVIDDGAVFYLNGQEFFRLGMPSGAVSQSTPASRTIGDAALEGPFDSAAAALRVGDNVLAVEVHQANSGSSDVVLGAALEVVTLRSLSFTPNAPNAVSAPSDRIPPVWINEFVANNNSGAKDESGQFEPWLELYNESSGPVALKGWSLTDNFGNLAKWGFPDDTIIPGKGFLLVWLDGDGGASTADHLHAGFRVAAQDGVIALTARQNGIPGVVDYVSYSNLTPSQALSLSRDGDPFSRGVFNYSSPGSSNEEVPAIPPRLAVVLDEQTLSVSCTVPPGSAYRIETSTPQTLPQWAALTNGVSPDGAIRHSEPIRATEARFYRVVLP